MPKMHNKEVPMPETNRSANENIATTAAPATNVKFCYVISMELK